MHEFHDFFHDLALRIVFREIIGVGTHVEGPGMARGTLRHDDEAGIILPVAGIKEHLGSEDGPFVAVPAFTGRVQIKDQGIERLVFRLFRREETVKEGIAVRTAKLPVFIGLRLHRQHGKEGQ